jgi:hypothetical protein
LSEASSGAIYEVSSVYERDRNLLEFFEQKGIRPGTHLKVYSRNYDGTLSLAAEKKRIELGGAVAGKIWVKKS